MQINRSRLTSECGASLCWGGGVGAAVTYLTAVFSGVRDVSDGRGAASLSTQGDDGSKATTVVLVSLATLGGG